MGIAYTRAYAVAVVLLAFSCIHVAESYSLRSRLMKELWEQVAKPFDMLVLTEMWGPTFCKMEAAKSKTCQYPTGTNYWTIHGLWPVKYGQKGPLSCEKTKLDPSHLTSIRSDLLKFWPTMTQGGSVEKFWNHEYTKHGTCAASLTAFNSQLKYFTKTLDLYKAHSLKTALSTGKVAPSSRLFYNLADVKTALRTALGGTPGVFCYKPSTEPGVQYLWEIRTCYDKSLNIMNCTSPNLPGAQCDPGKVKYPPFPSATSKSLDSDIAEDAMQFLFDIAEMGDTMERQRLKEEEEQTQNLFGDDLGLLELEEDGFDDFDLDDDFGM